MEIKTIKNKRLTPAREAICSFFERRKEPSDYSQIEKYLSSKGLKVNKTTIYRQLDLLLELGYINELDFGEGKKRYELKKDHHHHFLCTKCQKIECIEVGEDIQRDLKRIETKLLKNSKYKIQSHVLEFFGLCNLCQEKICKKA